MVVKRDLSDYKLSELVDVSILQRVQDGFFVMTGMEASITDASGIPITRNECYFNSYDYVADIKIDDIKMGSFCANKTSDIDEKKLEAMENYLITTAETIADVARVKYMGIMANAEIERAANMKSDFLANMSHEIRTPMNAVIGMAEMALREDLTPTAKDYINQIKSSGHALLNIINDILDFSKIDSGKMDIIPIEYEPLTLFNDVSNIVVTRLKDKPVELLLEVDPSFPRKLYGDNLRIRQIVINLANNAVKFTRKGRVKIEVSYSKKDNENILMNVSIKDTGIGIKKEDFDKLFESFMQVDSKRNRNIEGTGLGLAICHNLVELMGGHIGVESEYEKGSTFSFEIPQKVIEWEPSIVAKDADNMAVIGYFSNKYLARQFYKDTGKLGVYNMSLVASDYFDKVIENNSREIENKKLFIFMEKNSFGINMERIIKNNMNVTGVIIVDFFDDYKTDIPNIRVLKKPLSSISIAMALNNEEYGAFDENKPFEFDFVAPKAKVLIVDDNAINLTVAEGLLEPLNMQLHGAGGGKQALEMIEKDHYDLIFMDHMMPDIDGVETTRIIRRMHPEYNEVPIIALTANAIEGTKEMFLQEGMNDFVPKPIEIRSIVEKVKYWLPDELIEKTNGVVAKVEEQTSGDNIYIGDLDTDSARKLLGSDKLFWSVLTSYYKTIDSKAELIEKYAREKDWPSYTIEVHALKSSSKQIGAMELSDMAAELEKAGNARDVSYILNNTERLLIKYRDYKKLLKAFCEKEDTNINTEKKYADKEQLEVLFEKMLVAVDNLDMDEMENVINEMDQYEYEGETKQLYSELREAVESIDVDACTEIITKWKEMV